jgi:hypothetical protein
MSQETVLPATEADTDAVWVARGICGCIDAVMHEGWTERQIAELRARGIRMERVPRAEAQITRCPHRLEADLKPDTASGQRESLAELEKRSPSVREFMRGFRGDSLT